MNEKSLKPKDTPEEEDASLVSIEEKGVIADRIREEVEGVIEDPSETLYWVLQRVIWGIIKSLVIFLIIMILVWFFWKTNYWDTDPTSQDLMEKSSQNTEESSLFSDWFGFNTEKTPAEIQKEKEIKQKIQNLSVREKLISNSVLWLERASFMGKNAEQQITNSLSIEERNHRVVNLIREVDRLFEEATVLKKDLTVIINGISEKKDVSEESYKNARLGLQTSIKDFNANLAPIFFTQAIQSRKEFVDLLTNYEIFQKLYNNIGRFELLLREKTVPLFLPIYSEIQSPESQN